MVLAHKIDEACRTKDIHISQDVTFETMLLASKTLQGLKNSGFFKPSPVQLHGIPLGKCGFDLLLEAKSGTGKTAVFSVIALEKLELDKGLQVVILAPTREIASQICDVIKQIGFGYEDLIVEVVMGGLPVADDIAKFKRNVHVVVGSPGRLRHLIQDKHIDVSSVRLLVLDEADKLMEKSFLPDINFIFSILPNQKQVIMSSATYPESTKTFINKYLKCAQHICPDSNCVLLGVEQKITIVKCNSNIVRQTQFRFQELLKLLSKKQFKQCLIFCNYQARVNELYKLLNKEKWPVEQLCSQQLQSDRLDALKTLQEYKCRILIATDLAARGIDASNVDLVINFEPPFEWQTYLHRIGRAGRYGSYGMSITILSEGKEENEFKNMLQSINTLKITHFWSPDKTDENIQEIDQSCTLPTNDFITLVSEIEYQEIWKSLTSKTTSLEIKEEVDDFEVLCKSFKEQKHSTVESFTDLFDSYKNHKYDVLNEDNNNNYQCINIKLKQTFLKSDQNHRNPVINNTVEDSLVIEENEIDIKNNKFTRPENKSKVITNKICNRYIKHENDYDNYGEEIEADVSTRALMEAGLPLAFGKSKSNSRKEKAFTYRQHKSRGMETYKNNYQQSHEENVIDINYKKPNATLNRTQESPNKKKTKNTKKRSECHCSGVSGTKFNNTQANSINGNYNQGYLNWYKLLKARVKYIELSFYIEEMSKI